MKSPAHTHTLTASYMMRRRITPFVRSMSFRHLSGTTLASYVIVYVGERPFLGSLKRRKIILARAFLESKSNTTRPNSRLIEIVPPHNELVQFNSRKSYSSISTYSYRRSSWISRINFYVPLDPFPIHSLLATITG